MNIQGKGFPLDLGGSFTEDAPRPPVPGEEGELVSTDPRPVSHGFYSSKGDVVRNETSTATPRRSDLDLGYEPEGSASPTPPYLKWAESLHSLLDDQDGINLFRTFLKQEDCADLLDFWFACSGFRKLEPCASNEEKRLKLAKAIYKKYILDNNGIVSRQIKPATKSFIKDCVVKLQIDPDMFDQAQTEIQCMIEDNTYPLFLKSDIYLEYTRTGGESPKIYSDPSSGSGTGKGLPGYLPTLNEDEEWKCDQEAETEASRDSVPSSRLTQKLLLETATQRATSARRYSEGREFRHGSWREPVNPYYVNTGYALAPATSANDSEQQSMSSDADTMSLTDSSVLFKRKQPTMKGARMWSNSFSLPSVRSSDCRSPTSLCSRQIPCKSLLVPSARSIAGSGTSVSIIPHIDSSCSAALALGMPSLSQRDGIPPYRLRKQHRREMQESAKANGRVPLPHIPRTYRMPKDIHVEPEKFAAELINRLEEVQKEREAEEKLEERLKRVRAEEEGEDADISSGPSVISHKMPSAQAFHHFAPRYSEMGCTGMQMRDAHEENPESILDEHVQRVMKTPGCQSPGPGRHSPKPRSPESGHLGKLSGTLGTIPPGHGKHATKSGMKLDASNLYHHKHVYHHIHHHSMMKPKEQIEAEATQRVQNSFAWNIDSHNYATKTQNYPENLGMAPVPMDSLGYSSSGAKKQLSHDMVRSLSIERPVAVHPWVSAQLRNVVQPSHPFIQDPTMPPNPAPNPLTQLEEARRRLEEEEKRAGKLPLKQRLKPQKRPGSGASQPCENIVVAYYFCGEPIPYRTFVKGRVVTLGQFKELLTKKGNYRYYFKKVSDEFDCGVVFEEVREDDTILPIFEEKIIGKVEKID
ncbi:axin-1 isoform X2 [Pezoporus occidentalis]|uniref:axin-1 isoform X2 n=1 Tax=Pezoporus occidentalis TaxID=407982 RepID=UPI002F917C0E